MSGIPKLEFDHFLSQTDLSEKEKSRQIAGNRTGWFKTKQNKNSLYNMYTSLFLLMEEKAVTP